MTTPSNRTILKVSGVNKWFPGVHALCDVDFDLKQGEVHALVGENGAGKSTLARIIAGILSRESGQMYLYDSPYRPAGRPEAQSLGVRMVMQELNLIPNLTIAENIFIDKLPNRFGFVDYPRLNQAAAEIMEQVGLAQLDPALPVRHLGIGQQQMVEIAAGLSAQCRILALDEPTASLTDNEVELLFSRIARLKAQGVGIIYISHRIEEVIRIADRITVLRDGMVVCTHATADVDADDVIRMMVGRTLEPQMLHPGGNVGPVALRVVELARGRWVKNVSFELHRGEILGVAGLMGSGRTETMRALFGADRPDRGKVYLGDSKRHVRIRSPRDAVKHGIALLTENRKEQGLFLPLPVRMNISFSGLPNISRLGWIDTAKEGSTARHYVDALSIRCSSIEQTTGQLSGGNQQKVVIAKWIYTDPDIIIFDEPTRGIDVGSRFEIYHMLGQLAQTGKALIVVSSDLKELMAVCDRIMVMSAGQVAGIFDRGCWTEQQIMSAAFSEYIAGPRESDERLRR